MVTANTRGLSSGRVASEAELIALLETLYKSRNPTRRWLHRTRRDWIIAKIAECARARPGRALEIGFGAGVYLRALATSYREAVATELDETHLAHARALMLDHPNLRVLIDDITASHLPPRSFDLVLCSEVIEHIRETNAVISGIHPLLAPGGFLLISTPQRYSLMEMACRVGLMPLAINLARRVYREAVFETGHINLMTRRRMRRALEAGGFEILQSFESGLYLPLLAEFAGVTGMRLERWLEKRLRGGPFGWILWTQYYLARPVGEN
jgi:2-polyprenyl-3-methyl-5-hydroxy-6-metoxy-1,4-benzoquinol methylase